MPELVGRGLASSLMLNGREELPPGRGTLVVDHVGARVYQP